MLLEELLPGWLGCNRATRLFVDRAKRSMSAIHCVDLEETGARHGGSERPKSVLLK